MPGSILPTCNGSLAGSRGFTYLGILFAVTIVGFGLAATGTVWAVSTQREKERQLLFVGAEFRRAIESYFLSSPSGVRTFPRTLEDLLEDRRGGALRRHLRKIYVDPMSNTRDWQLITLGDGVLIGVSSPDERRPIKRGNFSEDNRGLVDAECYCEWRFVYLPDTR